MIELKENIHYCNSLEKQVLGAMILENNAYGRCFKILGPDAFRNSNNQKVYNAIAEMWTKNLPVDHVTLFLKLCRSGFPDLETNTAHFLTTLTANVTSTATLEYSSLMLRQMYVEREIIRITTSGTSGEDGMSSVRNIEKELSKLRERIVIDDFKGIDEVLIELYKHMEIVKDQELTGISTGFKELDRMTGGLQPGGMYIVGARPSVGKSAFMGKMVLAAAKAGKAVGVISLEMTDNQITARLSSLCSEIDYWRIYRNRMGDAQQAEHFYKKAAELSHLPICISDATGVNISDIKAKIARLKARGKVDIVFIDYLQLLDTDDMGRNKNREQEVSGISRGLKLLAKDYDIPVVVLAQLNRTSEQGGDKKPKLHNLRESGSLEQDADGVLFIHRDWMSGIKVDEDGNSTESQADIIIGKWRDGEVGELKINFDGPKMKFYEQEEVTVWKPVNEN